MSSLENCNDSKNESETEQSLEELSTTQLSNLTITSDLISNTKSEQHSEHQTQIDTVNSKTLFSSRSLTEFISYKESEIRLIGLLSVSSLCFLALSTAFVLIVIRIYGQYQDPILVNINPEQCKKILIEAGRRPDSA